MYIPATHYYTTNKRLSTCVDINCKCTSTFTLIRLVGFKLYTTCIAGGNDQTFDSPYHYLYSV